MKTPAAQFRELERGGPAQPPDPPLSDSRRSIRVRSARLPLLATLAQLIPIRSHLGQLSRIAIAEPMTVGAVDKVQAPLTKWLLDRADKLATAFLKESTQSEWVRKFGALARRLAAQGRTSERSPKHLSRNGCEKCGAQVDSNF